MNRRITFLLIAGSLFSLGSSFPEPIELDCCDPTDPIEISGNITTAGLDYFRVFGTRHQANPNAGSVCRAGYQCVDCSNWEEFSFGSNVCKDIKCKSGERGPGKPQGRCFPCLHGDYCPEGTVNKYAHTLGVTCPDGQVCYEEVGERHRIRGYKKEICPEGHLCGVGTFFTSHNTSCQSLVLNELTNLLPNANLTEYEPNGFYCKEGTSGFEKLKQKPMDRLQKCQKGHYCPNSFTQETCPKGKFCKFMVAEPKSCPAGTCDSEGHTKPGAALERTWGLALSFLIIWVVCKGLIMQNERKQSEHHLKVIQQGKVREIKDVFVRQVLQGLDVDGIGAPPVGFDICPQPVSIKFTDLKLVVDNTTVLQKVSGNFQHSRMVAVMGPSGCGKSTLLNTLCARATYGKMKGEVLINGNVAPIQSIVSVMGFVPQDDTVYGDLTVYENIQYSARLRLPSKYTTYKTNSLIQGVVDVLKLTPIQHQIVGSVRVRGISGGQKKRVNIGVEMVIDPAILFLDEPTSGLGAAATLILMKALHSLALTRRTIISVIHQPRYQVFMLFHDIMLLFPGGYTVFFGPAYLAVPYFEKIGFKVPANENPADFFLDVLSGIVPKAGDPKFSPDQLHMLWRNDVTASLQEYLGVDVMKGIDSKHSGNEADMNLFLRSALSRVGYWWEQTDVDNSGTLDKDECMAMFKKIGLSENEAELEAVYASFDSDNDGFVSRDEFDAVFTTSLRQRMFKGCQTDSELSIQMVDARMQSTKLSKRKIIARHAPSVIITFPVLMQRCILQKLRKLQETLSNLLTLALCGLLVGVLLSSDHQPFDPGDPMMALIVCLIISVVATISAVSSINLFGHDKVMFLREHGHGLSTPAYFVSKCFLDLLENIWQPMFFLGVCYNWILPDISFGRFALALCHVSFAASGLGILLSLIVSPENMTIVTTIVSLVVGIFLNGMLGVYYEDVKKSSLQWLWSMSFSRWGAEIVLVGELKASTNEEYQLLLIQETIKYYGFFPRWKPYNEWEEGLSRSEMEEQWIDYLDYYDYLCYVALIMIGLILRSGALLALMVMPHAQLYYSYFKVTYLKLWPTDVAEYVAMPHYAQDVSSAISKTYETAKDTVRKSFRASGFGMRSSSSRGFKSSLFGSKKLDDLTESPDSTPRTSNSSTTSKNKGRDETPAMNRQSSELLRSILSRSEHSGTGTPLDATPEAMSPLGPAGEEVVSHAPSNDSIVVDGVEVDLSEPTSPVDDQPPASRVTTKLSELAEHEAEKAGSSAAGAD